MRASVHPSRILAVVSCVAFLVVALAPCPPPAASQHATVAEHPEGCEMHASSASVTPVCPCGCGERAPVAGASARLGVALPASGPARELVLVAARAPLATSFLQDCFVPVIDHVPLSA
jgi:hypothetical protein